jgi:hypothetical protein
VQPRALGLDVFVTKEPAPADIRRTRVRSKGDRALLLGALALVFLSAGCGGLHDEGGSSGGASCAGPYLSDQPPTGPFRAPTPTVSPGAAITIYGHWYTSTCNDTGGHDPLEPLPPVRLTLTLPGGAPKELGEFTPHGQDMGFSAVVTVPAGTPAGTATVRDDRPNPATYKFKVSE